MNSIKSDIHKLIDKINDETILLNFFAAMTAVVSKTDITDELNYKQKQRLKESVKQSKSGKTFTNEEVKSEIRQWLAK